MSFEYTFSNLIEIGKRYNNNKRGYLLINKLQAKHLACDPSDSLAMMKSLGNVLKNEGVTSALVIGFAETATAIAIGASLSFDKCFYIQTTREKTNLDYINFSELHSHAVEQKLIISKLLEVIDNYDNIVIIDDEITTGKTIVNLVNSLKNRCNLDNKRIFALSIIDRLDDDYYNNLLNNGIKPLSLIKTNYNDFEFLDKIDTKSPQNLYPKSQYLCYNKLRLYFNIDTRIGVDLKEYLSYCDEYGDNIINKINFNDLKEVLILGTEEFMYPTIVLGNKIKEKYGINVYIHSTTRSPISISDDINYPIHNGYELRSAYDEDRETFIYNLRKYDKVIIISDSKNITNGFIEDIVSILNINGSNNIDII